MLRKQRTRVKKIKIKMVTLLIPNSCKIGEVFSNNGIDHVIAFDTLSIFNKEIKRERLLALQLNYIYAFV